MGVKSVQRENKIVSLLEENGEVSVSQLVEAFNVSEVTIRRDLESLEGKGVLLRTYGGAVRREEYGIGDDFVFGEKEKKNILKKKAIASAAFESIKPEETIFLDSGTTALEMARIIKDRNIALTVVTNSLPIASELINSANVNIFLLGGFLRRKLYDFTSPFFAEEIQRLSFSRAFLGVDGISAKSGLTTTDIYTARLEEAVMESSNEIIIVADSSKIGKRSLISYGKGLSSAIPWTLITDSGAPAGEIEEIKKSGLKVKTAEA